MPVNAARRLRRTLRLIHNWAECIADYDPLTAIGQEAILELFEDIEDEIATAKDLMAKVATDPRR